MEQEGKGARPPQDKFEAPLETTATNIGTLKLRGVFENKKYKLVGTPKNYRMDVLALSDVHIRGQIETKLGDYQM